MRSSPGLEEGDIRSKRRGSELMSEPTVPVHQQAGDAEDGEGQARSCPKDFDRGSPESSEVKRMHCPDDPVSGRLIAAVMPYGEDVRIAGGDGDDVAVREVACGSEIDECIDNLAGESRIADAEEPSSGRCLVDSFEDLRQRSSSYASHRGERGARPYPGAARPNRPRRLPACRSRNRPPTTPTRRRVRASRFRLRYADRS